MKELYLKSVDIKKDKIPQNDYIYDLSVIKNFKKIEFKKPITIFVGENGLGKSTLIEAIATKLGFNAEGGSKHFNFKTRQTEYVSLCGWGFIYVFIVVCNFFNYIELKSKNDNKKAERLALNFY